MYKYRQITCFFVKEEASHWAQLGVVLTIILRGGWKQLLHIMTSCIRGRRGKLDSDLVTRRRGVRKRVGKFDEFVQYRPIYTRLSLHWPEKYWWLRLFTISIYQIYTLATVNRSEFFRITSHLRTNIAKGYSVMLGFSFCFLFHSSTMNHNITNGHIWGLFCEVLHSRPSAS